MEAEEQDEHTREDTIAKLQRAMVLLYKTCIISPEIAAHRGQAIRSIDAMLTEMGEESYIPICEENF